MSYAPANIVLSSFYRYLGDSAALAMTLTDPDTGAAFNPTGCVLIFTAKIRVSDPDSAAVIQKISTVGGFTITNATLGQVSLALVPSDYAALVSLKTYQIDVQAQVIATGTVKTVLRGTLLAETDVTRNTTLSIPTYTTNPSVQFGNYAALVLAGIASGVQSATLLLRAYDERRLFLDRLRSPGAFPRKYYRRIRARIEYGLDRKFPFPALRLRRLAKCR